ncbi:MAG: hypothetical protein PHG96_09360 [Kiritimatiellae bacterium]|nr:hypothetical protein [Kiritimatiellia bacterium]MDD3545546.1 hypothetical protein [Kiritimatiellia bacterium]MDD4621989.1 hypothetical protein [Kiritimatiellia bacterium]
MITLDTFRAGCGACALLLPVLPVFGLFETANAPDAALQAKTEHALRASGIAESQRTERRQALEQSATRAETLFSLPPEQVDRLTRGTIREADVLNARARALSPDSLDVPPTVTPDADETNPDSAYPGFASRLRHFLIASLLVIVSSILLYKKTAVRRAQK